LLCLVEASADWVCGNLLLSDGHPHPLHQLQGRYLKLTAHV
jgi:hypothetical protein